MRSRLERAVGRLRMAAAIVATIACTAAGPTLPPIDGEPAEPFREPIALRGVSVVDVESGLTIPDQTVLIRDGRILAIGPSATAQIASDVRVIDAPGRFVAPGLIDMHVHLRTADVTRYVAFGVTAARHMWGYSTLPTLVQRIESGAIHGPAIFAASPGIDAPPAAWPETRLLTDASQAAAVVDEFHQAGWRFLKVYDRLSADVYDAIMAASRARGIPVIGHVPRAVTIQHALLEGQRSIEHLSGYDRAISLNGGNGTFGWSNVDESRSPALVAATRASTSWNCPTLAIFGALMSGSPASDRERMLGNRRRFVRALHDAGARLLVGTDAGIDIVAPGSSMHDELREFAASGLSPAAVLRLATRDAAEFLGALDSLGTVAQGKRAELLLLDRDPLRDLGALSDPAAVILRGEYLPRTWLHARR